MTLGGVTTGQAAVESEKDLAGSAHRTSTVRVLQNSVRVMTAVVTVTVMIVVIW
jgi:hypothetical protein